MKAILKVSQSQTTNGRIDKEKLNILFKTLIHKDIVDDIFMCGPKEMTFLIQDHLLELGIDKKQIHFELFNTENIVKKTRPVTTKIDTKNVSVVNIHEGGKVFKLTIPKGSDNILLSAFFYSF